MTKSELGEVAANINFSENAVEKSGKELTNKSAKKQTLKLEMERLNNLDKHDNKIRECLAWKCWFDVYAEEDILRELQKQLDVEESVLHKAQKELLEAESDEAASGNKEELRIKMEDIAAEVGDVMIDIEQRNSNVKEKNLEMSAIQRDLKSITGNRAENNSRLNMVKKEISDQRARALESAEDDERAILQKIDVCDKFVEKKKDEEQAFREQKNIATQKMEELKREVCKRIKVF
jgi:hypothetical protein